MIRTMWVLVTILVAVLFAGCFEKPSPECALRCSPTGDCPPDYTCAADRWCKTAAVASDPNHVCEGASRADAAVAIDGAAFDARTANGGAPCEADDECGAGNTVQCRIEHLGIAGQGAAEAGANCPNWRSQRWRSLYLGPE